MKKSKKGVTLVELVICCFIIVMLGGACTAVLMSGEHIFSTSSKAAGAQLDGDVVQTYLLKLLPYGKQVKVDTLASVKASTTGNGLYFDDENDNEFTIRIDGDNTTVAAITGFRYKFVEAGDAASTTARAQFVYKVSMDDGGEFSGGFVMSNIKYTDVESLIADAAAADPGAIDGDGYADLKKLPFYFSPTAAAGGGGT